MFKKLQQIEYKLFIVISFYTISTTLFIASPFMRFLKTQRSGFDHTQTGFNAILLFLCLFLLINLVIIVFIFLTENKIKNKRIIIGLFNIMVAIIFALFQWGFISLANKSTEATDLLWFKNLILPLILNLLLCLFFNEFIKWIAFFGNRNQSAKCFVISNWGIFLFKTNYILINNNVLLTYNKWGQVDLVMFDQFEDELLDFGGEEKKVFHKKNEDNTKDLLDDFKEPEPLIVISEPNKKAKDLLAYIAKLSEKIETQPLCILSNTGVFYPIFKGNVPNYITHLKKTTISKKIKDNLIKGTELSFLEIKEKI